MQEEERGREGSEERHERRGKGNTEKIEEGEKGICKRRKGEEKGGEEKEEERRGKGKTQAGGSHTLSCLKSLRDTQKNEAFMRLRGCIIRHFPVPERIINKAFVGLEGGEGVNFQE